MLIIKSVPHPFNEALSELIRVKGSYESAENDNILCMNAKEDGEVVGTIFGHIEDDTFTVAFMEGNDDYSRELMIRGILNVALNRINRTFPHAKAKVREVEELKKHQPLFIKIGFRRKDGALSGGIEEIFRGNCSSADLAEETSGCSPSACASCCCDCGSL